MSPPSYYHIFWKTTPKPDDPMPEHLQQERKLLRKPRPLSILTDDVFPPADMKELNVERRPPPPPRHALERKRPIRTVSSSSSSPPTLSQSSHRHHPTPSGDKKLLVLQPFTPVLQDSLQSGHVTLAETQSPSKSRPALRSDLHSAQSAGNLPRIRVVPDEMAPVPDQSERGTHPGHLSKQSTTERKMEPARRPDLRQLFDIGSDNTAYLNGHGRSAASQKRPSTAEGSPSLPLSSSSPERGQEHLGTSSTPHTSSFVRTQEIRRRRASLDVSTLLNAKVSTQASDHRPIVMKTLSSWMKKSKENQTLDGVPEGFLLESSKEVPQPLGPEERALNVKRARKMVQLFGSEPPKALFQINNIEPERSNGWSIEQDRTSFATSFSSSTVNLFGSLSPPPPCTDSNASSSTIPNIPTVTPSTAAEPTYQKRNKLNPLGPPGSLAPFTTAIQSRDPTPSTSSSTLARCHSMTEREFRQRRLRAAKLSKFFGVGYQDLTPFIPERPATHSGTESEASVEITIAVGGRHRQNKDFKEVMSKLRSLKSS